MVQSKEDAFLGPEVRLGAFSKALAHPARVAILKILAERGTCTCGEVVAEMPLAQATVSQHLRALRESGLVEATADGPRMRYRVAPDGLRSFERTVRFFFAQVQRALEEAPKA